MIDSRNAARRYADAVVNRLRTQRRTGRDLTNQAIPDLQHVRHRAHELRRSGNGMLIGSGGGLGVTAVLDHLLFYFVSRSDSAGANAPPESWIGKAFLAFEAAVCCLTTGGVAMGMGYHLRARNASDFVSSAEAEAEAFDNALTAMSREGVDHAWLHEEAEEGLPDDIDRADFRRAVTAGPLPDARPGNELPPMGI